MTSKLTRLTDDELTETLRQATSGYPLPASVEGNLRHAFAELQERRKAAMDGEPVAYIDKQWTLVYYIPPMSMGLKIGDKLYRHAQPAPVVPDAYVRDERGRMMLNGVCEPKIGFSTGWNACRAAMLQAGSSPVIPDGKSVTASTGIPVIPDGYVIVPKEPTQAMCAAFNDSDYGRKSLRERYVAMLAAADCSIPMISDRWVPVSERMPERGDYLVTDGRDFDVQSFDGEQFIPGFVWEDAITHWMPLPAAPQEVK